MLICGLLLLWAGQPCLAQYTAQERKAGMVLTLAKFVKWPSKAFENQDNLVVGILGEDPFGPVIDQMLRNRAINGRNCEVRRGRSVQELRGSHIIVFGGGLEAEQVRRMLSELSSRQQAFVLTIGDNVDHFCSYGGALNLRPSMMYTLNVGAASRAQLTIDVKIMNLAQEIVQDEH